MNNITHFLNLLDKGPPFTASADYTCLENSHFVRAQNRILNARIPALILIQVKIIHSKSFGNALKSFFNLVSSIYFYIFFTVPVILIPRIWREKKRGLKSNF